MNRNCTIPNHVASSRVTHLLWISKFSLSVVTSHRISVKRIRIFGVHSHYWAPMIRNYCGTIPTFIPFIFMEYFSLRLIVRSKAQSKLPSKRRTICDLVAGTRIDAIHVLSHRVTFTTLTLDKAHLDAGHVPKQTSLKVLCHTNKFGTTLRTVALVTMDTWRTVRYIAGIVPWLFRQ